MNSFNKIKLTDLAKRQTANTKTDKLDLVLYDVDYLGSLDIESKYLQASTIPWLIAQVKLLELNKRINSVSIEINVRKNTIACYKNDFFHNKPKTFGLTTSRETNKRSEVLNHKLTSIFKLTQHSSEKNCFAYFYRHDATFTYTLHVFSSTRSNIVQALHEFQMSAMRLHEHTKIHYEKMFDFKIVNKIRLAKEQLNSPNFMDNYIDKSKNDPCATSNLNLLIKFKSNKLCLEIINEKSIEKEYHHIVYLNTSITNKNYFCLAYFDNNEDDDEELNESRSINALILYSREVNSIDDVIREYALKISTELNASTPPSHSTKRTSLSKLEQHTCFLCPMQQYVELCEYLNQFQANDEKVYQILNEKISHNLDKLDQNYLLDCLNEQNLNLNTYEDLAHTNQLLVGLIQRLCKSKQNQHLILSFNSANVQQQQQAQQQQQPQEFTFFLMKNFKQSKSTNLNVAENNENTCPNAQTTSAINGLPPKCEIKKRIKPQRSNTIETSQNINLFDSKLKRTNIKLNSNELFLTRNLLNHSKSTSTKQSQLNCSASSSTASIRRYIYNKIVGAPNAFYNSSSVSKASEDDQQQQQQNENKQRFKLKYDTIQLWKKVISEQILLIKMEKENKRLRVEALARQTDAQTSRFGYVEITPCLKEIDKVWESKLEEDKENPATWADQNEIRHLLSKGIPQTRRGDVWFWLVKQYRMRRKVKTSLNLDATYQELLKQYSIHQHSILLDLGRTFPNHPNFKFQPTENENKSVRFGLGQLALFNVLKAYSIFDNEVGYCQGLSFVVGFLLIQLNNDEEKAFELLKFLLVDLNLREQYMPNMKDLQKHMYQLSRLINENCNDIYLHLENNEISTSLYAASWFLTLFSSHFQMGFIARVFDFLFFEGKIVLFKLALSILTIHKPILLSCSMFESIVEQLKTTIPEMSLIECELIINKSITYDSIEHMLHNYEIEFNILNEEFDIMSAIISNSQLNSGKNDRRTEYDKQQQLRINQLEIENSKLRTSVEELNDKLKICHLKMENQEDYILKLYHENRQFKVRIDTLEIERDVILKKIHQQQEKLYFNGFKQ